MKVLKVKTKVHKCWRCFVDCPGQCLPVEVHSTRPLTIAEYSELVHDDEVSNVIVEDVKWVYCVEPYFVHEVEESKYE